MPLATSNAIQSFCLMSSCTLALHANFSMLIVIDLYTSVVHAFLYLHGGRCNVPCTSKPH
jgi:hypothetical protein